jgi:O6-methylguanine-DNA--protein-cysteine methyltransferase
MAQAAAHRLLNSSEAAAELALRSRQLQESVLQSQQALHTISKAALLNEQRLRMELETASLKLGEYETQIHELLRSIRRGVQTDYDQISNSLDTIKAYSDSILQLTKHNIGSKIQLTVD